MRHVVGVTLAVSGMPGGKSLQVGTMSQGSGGKRVERSRGEGRGRRSQDTKGKDHVKARRGKRAGDVRGGRSH